MKKGDSLLITSVYHHLNGRSFKVVYGLIILIGLLAVLISTFSKTEEYRPLWLGITYLSGAFFLVEYALRILASPLEHPNVSPLKARLHYLFSFWGWIDFVSLLPFALPFFFSVGDHGIFALARLFLVFKFTRYFTAFQRILSIFHSIRRELAAIYLSIGVLICFSSLLMYYIERQAQPEVFDNVGEGFWLSVITITSVGFGDIYPITALGKILGGVIALLGVVLFAIPTGLVSSAFIKKREEEDRSGEGFCPHCGKRLR